MRSILLFGVAAALLVSEAACDPFFEQAAVKNRHGAVANGLLFTRSHRCFVLTVGHVVAGGPYEIWTEREYGRATLLAPLPDADLGLLEVASEDGFLCAGGELPPATSTGGSDRVAPSSELASSDLFLTLVQARGTAHREPVELGSIGAESLSVVAPGPPGRFSMGWSGSVLWQHRPNDDRRPLAILQRLPIDDAGDRGPADAGAPADRPHRFTLLRLGRAIEIVEPHLPGSGSGATELARRRFQPRLGPGARELAFQQVLRSNPGVRLLISTDRTDWAPVRDRFELPPGALTFWLKPDPDGEPIEYSARQMMLDSMLEDAKKTYRYLNCSGNHCTFEAHHVLPVVRTVRMGRDRSSLDQVFEPSMPLEEFLEVPGLKVDRLLPKPLCAGPLFYQVELVDGSRTPILSAPHRQAEVVCPPPGTEFEDPRVLRSADPDAVLAYATFKNNLFENRIELDTYLGLEVEAIEYAYDGGQAAERVTRTLGSFQMPADLEAGELRLELELRGGRRLGPFSYPIDFFALKQLRALTRFDERRFLRCFRADPNGRSAYGRYVEERAAACFAEQGNGSNEPWIAVDRVEAGTTLDQLDTTHTIDARRVDRDYRARYLVAVFPYDTEAVYARVRFFNGVWSEVRRFVVLG